MLCAPANHLNQNINLDFNLISKFNIEMLPGRLELCCVPQLNFNLNLNLNLNLNAVRQAGAVLCARANWEFLLCLLDLIRNNGG